MIVVIFLSENPTIKLYISNDGTIFAKYSKTNVDGDSNKG